MSLGRCSFIERGNFRENVSSGLLQILLLDESFAPFTSTAFFLWPRIFFSPKWTHFQFFRNFPVKFQTEQSIFHIFLHKGTTLVQSYFWWCLFFLVLFYTFSPRSCNDLFHEQFNFPPRFPPPTTYFQTSLILGDNKEKEKKEEPKKWEPPPAPTYGRKKKRTQQQSKGENLVSRWWFFTTHFVLFLLHYLVDSVLHFSPLNIFFNKLPCVPIELHNSDPAIIWSLYCSCWVCVNSK